MAAIKGIKGDPIGAFKHDLRERITYRNEDIDPERIDRDYILSGHSKGTTSGEIYSYYRSLVDKVYHRWKSTITTAEVVITAPEDLPEGSEEDFFRTSADFLRDYFFDGDSDRELLCVVHRDESKDGAEGGHMHYIFVMPETENEDYMSGKDKFVTGLSWVEEECELTPTDDQKTLLAKAVVQYERDGDLNEAVHSTADALSLERDDARKVLFHLKRTEKQKYEDRLMSKDEFLTRQVFQEFHPAFQKWIDENGPACTVYQGGGTISIPVEQLKEMTRETGVKLDHALTPKELGELLKLRDRAYERDAWGRTVEHEVDKTWNR